MILDIHKALNILQTCISYYFAIKSILVNVSDFYFLLAYGNQNYKSKIHKSESISELFGFLSYSTSTTISMLLFESND